MRRARATACSCTSGAFPGGQFSEGVLARLAKGDKLEVEIPFGEFYLRTGTDKPMVCLATGTGFAPIKSIIEDLIARGNTRPVRLYWGGRRRQDMYLASLAGEMGRAHAVADVHAGAVGARRRIGTARSASFMTRCCGTFPICRAGRSMPAAIR